MWAETYISPESRAKGRERANCLANALCRDALAWAKTIAVCASPARAQEQELFEEVIEYTLSLTNLRLNELEPAEAKSYLRFLRERTAIVKAWIKWRRAGRHRRLAGPAAQSRCGTSLVFLHALRDNRLTKQMFEDFRAATGLGSNVLVGKGENLASLVFYIAVHAVLSAERPLSREKALAMHRACRRCRTHFEQIISAHLRKNGEGWLQLGPGE